MKKTTKLKVYAFLVAMALGVLSPTTINAQSEDWFRVDNPYSGNRISRAEWTVFFGTQNFGEPAPLGAGLLIMLGAGAGYALLKKKED